MRIIKTWDDLPLSAPLKFTVSICVEYGEEKHWFICSRCDFDEIQCVGDRWFGQPVECLLFDGAKVKSRTEVPKWLKPMSVVVPARYVTYIGLGPEVRSFLGNKPAQRMIIAADLPAASNSMSPEAIRANLAEFREPLSP